MTRKTFLQNTALAAGGMLVIPAFTHYRFPDNNALAPELVKEFVGAAHGNLEKTKTMLAETPNLLNAAWDWGDGDFETGIGGAGHMGNVEIANFLLEQGARVDVFVLTMLGKTDIVKGMIEAFPALLRSPGPHGLSLLHHAEKGGEPAKELHDYLRGKGLQEKSFKVYKR